MHVCLAPHQGRSTSSAHHQRVRPRHALYAFACVCIVRVSPLANLADKPRSMFLHRLCPAPLLRYLPQIYDPEKKYGEYTIYG